MKSSLNTSLTELMRPVRGAQVQKSNNVKQRSKKIELIRRYQSDTEIIFCGVLLAGQMPAEPLEIAWHRPPYQGGALMQARGISQR